MKAIQISIQRAAAEFAIIVLGVLAAFAVDNWNQARSNAVLEAQYLARLLDDVSIDIETLEFTLELAARKNAALEVARTWRVDMDPPEQLIGALRSGAGTLGFSLPELNTATYDDLTNSGRLVLIRDTSLRREVLEYYRRMSSVRERLERRMTGFPGYLYSILEPDLHSADDHVYSEALARCEETCLLTLEAARTLEFRRLVNAEANYGQEIDELIPEFLERSRGLKARLLAGLGR